MMKLVLGMALGLAMWAGALSAPGQAATVSELKKAAAAGDPKAQYDLGVKYEYGQGVDQNYGEAAKWTQMSAAQGYADGQYNYGLMLEYGQGVGQNFDEADKWYTRAAEQGMEGAAQARRVLARKRNPPQRAVATGSSRTGPDTSLGRGQGQGEGMGSSALRDRDRLRSRSSSSARPDR